MEKETFVLVKRVTALCDVKTSFSVNKERVIAVMEESGHALSKEDAIGFLLKNGECDLVDQSVEIDETVMVHDTNIEID